MTIVSVLLLASQQQKSILTNIPLYNKNHYSMMLKFTPCFSFTYIKRLYSILKDQLYQSMKRVTPLNAIQTLNPSLSTEEEDYSPRKKHGKHFVLASPTRHNTILTSHTNRASSKVTINNLQYLEENTRKKSSQVRTCKSASTRRSYSDSKQKRIDIVSAKLNKPHSMSRYDTRREAEQSQLEEGFKLSFQSAAKSKKILSPTHFCSERVNPSPEGKDELMKRVERKIVFMRKMAEKNDSCSPQRSLFRCDKMYEFCLKNINKCINIYEKDLTKQKDTRYYELKQQGSILTQELRQIRNGITKERKDESQGCLGVVGEGIDVKDKSQSHRLCGSHYKKKVKKINKAISKECQNPFRMQDMHGWEIGIQKSQEFYI